MERDHLNRTEYKVSTVIRFNFGSEILMLFIDSRVQNCYHDRFCETCHVLCDSLDLQMSQKTTSKLICLWIKQNFDKNL